MVRGIALAGLSLAAVALGACRNNCCPSPCGSPCSSYGARPAYSAGPSYGTPGYAPRAYGTPGYAAPSGAPGYGAPAAGPSYGGGAPSYGTAGGTAAPQAGDVVTVQNHAYAPATLMVKAGTTVRWVNRDSVAHSATGQGFDLELPPGGEGSYTFATAGSFEVHCRYHANMRGRVVVQ